MALIYRNGRPYSYRSVRRNGRVTSEYRGSGETALLIERIEALERGDRELARSLAEAEQEKIEAADQVIRDFFDLVEDLTRAALLASGFHEHKHQWRRSRDRSKTA